MVSVETTTGLERRMKVQVPAERIENEVDSRLQRYGKSVRIKGFRPGKVPLTVVRQRYGGQIRSEVLSEVMQSSYLDAITQEQLRPAGGPHIEPDSIEQGKDLEYTATFEVYPEVVLSAHEGLEVRRPVAEIGEADIDEMMERLRRQRADWQEVPRAAADGDRLTVDFEGTIDGEPFAGGKGEAVPIVLGEGGMLADFESGLQSMQADEEKNVEVKFPDDYGAEELAGKTAVFHVKAHRVEEQQLPELDDAFSAGFGIEEGGLEKLRAEVAENMRREMEQTVRAQLKRQVLTALTDAHEVDLPNVLIDDEIRNLRESSVRRMGLDPSDPSQLPPADAFEQPARDRVKLGLLVAEVIRAAAIDLDQARVRERLRDIASAYGDPQEVLKLYTGNRQMMERLEMEVMEDQVVDWLLEHAKMTDQAMSFKELMNPK